jgi:UDP-2,4-diacetamido-2,4,6-trideoxy-beta-L-altropyranose hydrolase
MKISIVTEGFHSTGFGHIGRCQAIYQAFDDRSLTPTFYINGDDSCNDFLKDTKFELINWLDNPELLFDKIKGSEIIIVDSYKAPKEFYEKISSMTPFPVFIDDNKRLDYPAGIIINGAIYAEKMNYEPQKGYTYLLGPKYIPLRKDFWQTREKVVSPEVQNVLITFGGQDPENMTPRMLRMFVRNFPELKKYVVVGGGFNNAEQINEIKDENTIIITSPTAGEMFNVMLESDVAISAAGQTIYELAHVGVPTIAVSVAENQNNNMAGWLSEEFLLAEYTSQTINLENLLQVTFAVYQRREQRIKLTNLGRKKVDGLGAKRIAQTLIDMAIAKNSGFYFRKALEKDSTNLFNLINEKSVRMNAFKPSPVSLKDHTFWHSRTIVDPKIIYLLAFNASDDFIGQVRLDLKDNNAIINIALNKDFRGKALSVPMIRVASFKCLAECKEVEYIISYIKPHNIPAIKGFTHSAYVRFKEEFIDDERYFIYKLLRKK